MPALSIASASEIMIRIEAETPPRFAEIQSLLVDAFGGPDEAGLVDDLRRSGDVVCALAAVDETGVAGHVVFSRLTVEIDGNPIQGVALAPLAVRPDCRNRGVGADLVLSGLDICRSLDYGLAVVVGDPAYYGRFGFLADIAGGLRSVFAGPYLQVLALSSGALGSGQGTITYAPPFARFS